MKTYKIDKFQLNIMRYFLWFLLIVILILPTSVRSSEANETENFLIYLPIVSKPLTGIRGEVTWAGKAAKAVELKLRFYNGTGWSTLATTQTEIDGTYAFEHVPSLEKDQIYYVRYDNPNDDIVLIGLWSTPALATYQAGSYFNLGKFDIGGVLLSNPPSGAYVDLPCRFNWNNFQFRPNNNNSYEFNIYQWQTGNPYFYTNVGATNAYTMSAFPAGFTYNAWYAWDIWVYDSIGGFGISNDTNYVIFTTPAGHTCATLQSLGANIEESARGKDHPALILGDVTFR